MSGTKLTPFGGSANMSVSVGASGSGVPFLSASTEQRLMNVEGRLRMLEQSLQGERQRADKAEADLAEKIRDEINLKLIVDVAKNNQEELRESRDSFQRVGILTMEKLAVAELKISELVAAFTPLIKHWDDLATGESANVDRARKALNQKSEGN